ncbi:hypothetical protein [Clostridium ihumii]|uniref:hypothetical protein n=1 Tax=Clostridium ihumii TaxID=1470356 RepID=UPI00058E76BA|nr:hypothetical protein [Clostridium ihumii]
MKKTFNLVMTIVAVGLTLTFAISSVIEKQPHNKVELKKISGDYSALNDINLEILEPKTTYSADKLVIGNDGEKVSKVKYDSYRNVSEEVLKNKKLYRDAMRHSGYINYDNENYKFVVSSSFDYTGRSNRNNYRNTIHVAYKNKENNNIEKFEKVIEADGNINLLKAFDFENKVMLLLENSSMNEKGESYKSLFLYELELQSKDIKLIKEFKVEKISGVGSKDVFIINDNVYINNMNSVQDDKMSFIVLNLKEQTINTIETEKLNFGKKDLQVHSCSDLDGEYIYTLVNIREHYITNKEEQYFVKFNIKSNKFEDIKKIGDIDMSEGQYSDIVDLKVKDGNMYLLSQKVKEELNYYNDKFDLQFKVLNLNENKNKLELNIGNTSGYYNRIKLTEMNLNEN